ncbi:hypothetical protein HK103_004967 [Boothiomyces macroporosus]|uniref:Ribokinase n=1 Tax=Boothiomyces macroporosus TaxID=261099 RepID=A0AAD5Y316_9FUNG|nr:hypothetical protein HK103_004967 [Boothiomyces macroporosus]
MKVYVIGSVNIDDVYSVHHIVQPGETISSSAYHVHPGGKGANQAYALGKAGADVSLVACIGKDGSWLLDLYKPFVNVEKVLVIGGNTGRAIIQVDEGSHDNAIVLFPGANQQIPLSHLDFLSHSPGWIVLQNEINIDAANHAMQLGKANGSVICLNPAPCPTNIYDLKIDLADVLILNESEANQFAAQLKSKPNQSLDNLDTILELLNVSVVVITLGGKGVIAAAKSDTSIKKYKQQVVRTPNLVDTTGAGDTFVGYFISHLAGKMNSKTLHQIELYIQDALKIAVLASGIACETAGAMNSIPDVKQIEMLL